jgi:hypothetical protein
VQAEKLHTSRLVPADWEARCVKHAKLCRLIAGRSASMSPTWDPREAPLPGKIYGPNAENIGKTNGFRSGPAMNPPSCRTTCWQSRQANLRKLLLNFLTALPPGDKTNHCRQRSCKHHSSKTQLTDNLPPPRPTEEVTLIQERRLKSFPSRRILRGLGRFQSSLFLCSIRPCRRTGVWRPRGSEHFEVTLIG